MMMLHTFDLLYHFVVRVSTSDGSLSVTLSDHLTICQVISMVLSIHLWTNKIFVKLLHVVVITGNCYY